MFQKPLDSIIPADCDQSFGARIHRQKFENRPHLNLRMLIGWMTSYLLTVKITTTTLRLKIIDRRPFANPLSAIAFWTCAWWVLSRRWLSLGHHDLETPTDRRSAYIKQSLFQHLGFSPQLRNRHYHQ